MDTGAELKKLTELTAVSGYEMKFADYLKVKFSEYCDEADIDKFYNVSGFIKGNGPDKKKVMICAHCDEIGLMVKSIDENGFIKVTNIGGIDGKILPAQEVIIHGKKEIYGVVGAKPPHLLNSEEIKRSVKLKDLTIDTGMKSEEVKKYISIGDIITILAEPKDLLGSKISSKAMDNRCGVAALLKIMESIDNNSNYHDVYFIASAQEEVGLRGITIASYNVNPDIAIVVDACHGDIPDGGKEETYPLGKGGAIAIGPNLNKELTKKILKVAEDEKIPYQVDIEPGDSGTEAWATQVSRSGIPTLLVSIPVRYMHTPIETVNIDDVNNSAKLILSFIAYDGGQVCF